MIAPRGMYVVIGIGLFALLGYMLRHFSAPLTSASISNPAVPRKGPDARAEPTRSLPGSLDAAHVGKEVVPAEVADARVRQASEKAPQGLDISTIMDRVHALMAVTIQSLDAPKDLRTYLLDWRTLAKLRAVESKIATNEYEWFRDLDLMSLGKKGLETENRTVMVFQANEGVVLFSFVRGQDIEVFDVIDRCAAAQQEEWDGKVAEFNDRPRSERLKMMATHKECLATISKINREINLAIKANPKAALELAAARRKEIQELEARLLPFYIMIPKGSDLALARRSIGR